MSIIRTNSDPGRCDTVSGHGRFSSESKRTASCRWKQKGESRARPRLRLTLWARLPVVLHCGFSSSWLFLSSTGSKPNTTTWELPCELRNHPHKRKQTLKRTHIGLHRQTHMHNGYTSFLPVLIILFQIDNLWRNQVRIWKNYHFNTCNFSNASYGKRIHNLYTGNMVAKAITDH